MKKFLPFVIVQYQRISLLSTHKDLIRLQFKNTTRVFNPKNQIISQGKIFLKSMKTSRRISTNENHM
jgi:hypothetical protein